MYSKSFFAATLLIFGRSFSSSFSTRWRNSMRSVGLALLKPLVHSSARAALGGMCTAEAKLGAQQLRVDDDDAGREQQLRRSRELREGA